MIPANENSPPRVLLSAPVLLLVAILVGNGLNWLWPMYVDAVVIRNIAGWTYNLTATLLLFWCMTLFIRHRTTILPNHAVSTFISAGPYRFSRNPMYLALALYHLGIAMATGIIWHVFTFVPTLVAIRLWVIAPEEAYLSQRFGEEYQAYRARVPRWF